MGGAHWGRGSGRAWPKTLQGAWGLQWDKRQPGWGEEDPGKRRERTRWERGGQGREGKRVPVARGGSWSSLRPWEGVPGQGRSPGLAERSSRGEEGAETQGGGETNGRDRGGGDRDTEMETENRDATDTERWGWRHGHTETQR